MKQLLLSQNRGGADHGWLKSKHSFSFADYYNPHLMGFGDLRVINEDWIAGGTGFPLHPHQNMEIITIVLKGALEHRDTLGNSAVIRPGEVQYMAAGTGIRHSEFNHLTAKGEEGETHLYQIWILPDRTGHKPAYGQKSFAERFEKENLTLVASRDGREGSISINQQADVFVGNLQSAETLKVSIQPNRRAWIQTIEGDMVAGGEILKTGDALALQNETEIVFKAKDKTRFILFDLP